MFGATVKPKYEVHDHTDRMITETHVVREDGRNVETEVEVPYGYDVFFPAGHSIRVRTDDELKRLGFDKDADIIDMESSDTFGRIQGSLRRTSSSRARGKKRADTGSVDANQGE